MSTKKFFKTPKFLKFPPLDYTGLIKTNWVHGGFKVAFKPPGPFKVHIF